MIKPTKPFSTDNAVEVQRLEKALEAADIGSWELDLSTNQFRICERVKVFFNNLDEDILSYTEFLDLIFDDDKQPFTQAFHSALNLESEGRLSLEVRGRDYDKEQQRWFNLKGKTYFDSDNKPYHISGIMQDISQFVHTNQQLKQSKARVQTMIEQAPMAIGLLEGRELIVQVGNDELFKVFGMDKSARGIRLINAIPDIASQGITELLEDVYDSGNPFYGINRPLNLVRNGILEQVYFDFVFTPIKDYSETVDGVMILATDVTRQVAARNAVEESEIKFRTLIEEAPIAICVFAGKDMVVELVNEPMVGYWGKDMSVIGKPLRQAIPELDGQPFHDILANIYETGETYRAKNTRVDLVVNGELGIYYFDFTYKPLLDNKGKVYAIINISIDVTTQVLAQRALEESESKLRSVLASAPAAMGLFVGRELIVEMPNQAFIDIVGKGPDITGKPLREVMPELESQAFLQILDNVYTSGVMYQSFGTQVDIIQKDILTHNFYNITYTPLLNSEGEVYAILDIAIDVTEKMAEQELIKESQMQLLSLFEQTPVGIATLTTDLKFTMANSFYGELVGRKPEKFVGKPLLEAMPELKGQGFDTLLLEVASTGIAYSAKEQIVHILHNEQLETIYVDLTYQPQRDKENTIVGLFVVATDVTQQVVARKQIEEAEIRLRDAVEMAELGTWEIDLSTGILDYSDRLRKWFGIGLEETITIERAYAPIRASDRPRVKAAIERALTPGTDGIYDIEYTVEATDEIRERLLHVQGKTYFTEKGEAVKMNGTVQDVTEQRAIQLALEHQVKERTEEMETANEELAAGNEELASINEEYMAINEELSQANVLLIRSNENLQQFAYVASHDLQEPLRKIQSFGDLLKQRYGDQLGDGADYVRRMQIAASRMSILIEDLLTFSRVSIRQDATAPVALNNIVNSVLSTLELVIQESGAIVNVGDLPIVIGDESQLGQLFQNLISNALKFRKTDVTPEIHVRTEIVSSGDLPSFTKQIRNASSYHRIMVSDNGIGFDDKNSDRIFQVFQRLHGRHQYAGTGIGLAICEKVVTNHGGVITATSQLGQGSTFSVYLPI